MILIVFYLYIHILSLFMIWCVYERVWGRGNCNVLKPWQCVLMMTVNNGNITFRGTGIKTQTKLSHRVSHRGWFPYQWGTFIRLSEVDHDREQRQYQPDLNAPAFSSPFPTCVFIWGRCCLLVSHVNERPLLLMVNEASTSFSGLQLSRWSAPTFPAWSYHLTYWKRENNL